MRMQIFLATLMLTASSFTNAAEQVEVEITGHRGASYDAPENTLSSVRLGWEQNADSVEIDVWLSKDGHIVLSHDKDTKKCAGVDKLVVDQTLAELRQLDVGQWKNEKYAGERMPVLSEILPTIPTGKRLLIEIKCGPEIVPTLVNELQAAGRQTAETAVICFNADVVAAMKKARPDLQVYWLVGLKQDKKSGAWSHSAEQLVEKAKELHADGVDLSACDAITPAFGKTIKDAGLKLLVWTVNDPKMAKQMIAAGVEGITTDRPAWLREQLGLQ